jgi:hypothetical protein
VETARNESRLVADLDTVDTGQSLSGVELGGVLQIPEAALVHLLGDPAFVPDVRVTAALVERGEYALHLGLTAARDGQPGALRVMLVEVFRAVFDADLRQASTPRLEAHESDVPLKVGAVLGATARLDALPGRPGVVASTAVSGRFSWSGSSGPLRISATLQYCR